MQGVLQRMVDSEMADYARQGETKTKCNEIAVDTLVFRF